MIDVPHVQARSTVGLVLLATGSYRAFLPEVVRGAQSHLLGLRRIFVFSDEDPRPQLDGDVTWLPWGHLAWPFPTLLRYRAFAAHAETLAKVDVLLYSDVDMRFLHALDVTDAAGTIAVLHPGYVTSATGHLPYERRVTSSCSVPLGQGQRYFAGGVQGGRAADYLQACLTMADWIQSDIDQRLVPLWHDESAWNRYCHLFPPSVVLSEGHCSPEYVHDETAVIVALDKDHHRLRGTKSPSAISLARRRTWNHVRCAVGTRTRSLRRRVALLKESP